MTRQKTRGLTPGTPAPASGQYERRGPRGGRTGEEVTSIKGRPLPPGPRGGTFDLIDPTRHRR